MTTSQNTAVTALSHKASLAELDDALSEIREQWRTGDDYSLMLKLRKDADPRFLELAQRHPYRPFQRPMTGKGFHDGVGDWTLYRELPGLCEIDFHWSDTDEPHGYWESMDLVYSVALKALEDAYEDSDVNYVLFTHGWSTSRIGATTSRSQVRGLMRSTAATPYIDRKRCIQHYSVFVAAIKPKSVA